MNRTLSFLSLAFCAFALNAYGEMRPPIRTEVSRYTLLHDRNILMRDFARERHSSYLDFSLTFSSGLKRLISDVSEATQDDPALSSSANSTKKELNVYGLMTRHLNTERFLDAEVGVGIPLPAFVLINTKFLLNPFYSLGAGTSFSFTNNEDYLTPKVQLYLRKEEKIGLRILSLLEAKEKLTLNLYQLKRSDVDFSMTNTEITTKGKIFDLKDLNKVEAVLASDLIWEKEEKQNAYRLEVSELKLSSQSSKTTKKSRYGMNPLFRAEYKRNNLFPTNSFSPFLGIHYRARYSLDEGIYTGFQMIPFNHLPFHFTMLLDNQFFVLMPMLKTKWFDLIYSWRNPHQNSQNELWVPAMHTLEFNFPFF